VKTYNGMRSQAGLPSVFILDGIQVRPLNPQLRLEAAQMPVPEFDWGPGRSLAAYSLSVAMCVDAMGISGDDQRKFITSAPTAFDFFDRVVCQLPFWKWNVGVLDVLEILKSISRERGIVMGIEIATRQSLRLKQE
jgi:hypothetical protein